MYIALIHRSTRCFLLLCVLSVILAACSAPPVTTVPPDALPFTPVPALTSVPPSTSVPSLTSTPATYWPTEGWRTSTPEEQGIDSQKLAQVLAAIEGQHLKIHSLLIVRNGYLVSETYFEPYRQDTKHELYSVTKSFISTLIGIALDKGYIDRIDARIVGFFSGHEFANSDTQKEEMALDDLLTMRSGLDWQEGDPVYREMYQSRDWVQYVLDKPMAGPPGSLFNYCSGCSHLLSAILQQTTGLNTLDFAEQDLFQPLGISNVYWETDAAGIPIGGWGLRLTPRDMAKLGYLYLRDGMWDGKQIVSAEWVESATQKLTGTDTDLGYGYQWWTYPSLEAFTALGRYGQTIFVIPHLDMVIVTTAETDDHTPIFELIEDYVIPAAQ
jgi:CubicO group peptidase (beta-lactamase class C family)